MTRGLALLAVLVAGCPAPEPAACPEGQVQDADSGECVPEHCGSEPWGLLERTGETVHVAPWGDDDWDGSQEWPFRTIQEGANEAEHLVAVAAGTYLENISLDEDLDGIVIAGRCPELVVIDGSGEDEPGIEVTRGALGLRGLTATGGRFGVLVQKTGFGGTVEVELEDIVLVNNLQVGIAIAGIGALATVTRLEVTGTLPVEDGRFGRGVEVGESGALVARGLLVEENHDIGLVALNAGTSVDLEDTTVRNTRPGAEGPGQGVQVIAGAALIARGLLVEGNHDVGLQVSLAGTSVDLQDVTIRDTQPRPDDTNGLGVGVMGGASLLARGLLLEGNHTTGLVVADAGTSVDLEDVTIRDTRLQPDETEGMGVRAYSGASLVGRGLLLEGNHHVGLFATGAGTTVDLEDSAIRDTQPLPDETFGRGVEVSWGASLTGRGLLVEGNSEVGLRVAEAGTTVDMEDSTIRTTQPLLDGLGSRGVEVNGGASLVARRLLLEENGASGLFAWGAGTTVDLQDTEVRDTQSMSDGTVGRGLEIRDGASLIATGLLLDGNHEFGLSASGAGTTLDLEDSTIRDTQPLSDGTGGRGIELVEGASLIARGLLLEGNRDVGILAGHDGTTVELRDTTVRDTQRSSAGTFGRGVVVQDGANLVAIGLLLEGNHDIGLDASHWATVDLEDVTVRETLGDANGPSGLGISVQVGASATALDLNVQDNEGPGLYVVGDGTLEAHNVVLDGNGFAGAAIFDGSLALHGVAISGSLLHPSEQGGVGIFAWDLEGPADVTVESCSFSDLPGPALYLRGPGRYVMRDCSVTGTGSTPRLPGGVLALEGVERWREVGDSGYFNGLLLQGNSFDDLPSDAILLDSSSVTLDVSPETSDPNSFGTLGGVPLLWQPCGDEAAPEILDDSLPAPACEPVPRTLGPTLEYHFWTTVTEPVE